jgi:hypothetical protein
LVVDLFLPWYGANGTSTTVNAWEAFAVNDAILLLIALFAIGTWAVTATQHTSAVPMATVSVTALLAILGTLLVAIRLASTPTPDATLEYGAWLGLGACLGILAGAVWAMHNERTPRTAAPKIDVTPLPPPQAGAEGGAS